MENLRRNYRHSFPANQRLFVDLVWPGGRECLRGQVIDLGIEGLRVQLTKPVAGFIESVVVVRLDLPGGRPHLTLSSRVVSVRDNSRGQECGLRFLPLVDPAAQEARANLLWRYLMDVQRRGKTADEKKPVTLRLYRGD